MLSDLTMPIIRFMRQSQRLDLPSLLALVFVKGKFGPSSISVDILADLNISLIFKSPSSIKMVL